jgi:hypothetical protein
MVQVAFTQPGKSPPTVGDCLRLILAAKSRGWDIWNGDLQLVQYQEGKPAGLVTNYFMFTAEAQRAGMGDYAPPEFQIEINEKGFPTKGRVRMRRRSWPEGEFRTYPVDGGYIDFQQLAPKVKDFKTGGERLRATWAEPASGRHMFAKTLEARITRLVWADATRGLYLREEIGTFRVAEDVSGSLIDSPEPEVVVQDGDGWGAVAVAEPMERPKCPKCGKVLVVRSGSRGDFLACPGYPKCKHSQPLPDDATSAPESGDSEPEGVSAPDEPEAEPSEAQDAAAGGVWEDPGLTPAQQVEAYGRHATRIWSNKTSEFKAWLNERHDNAFEAKGSLVPSKFEAWCKDNAEAAAADLEELAKL